jgi:methyl-accepting chemotaxis protein
MKFYNNLKIGTKILTGFIIVCVLTGILGVYSIFSIKTINQGGNSMYSSSVLPLEELSSAQVNIIEVKNELLAATYEKDTDKIDEHERNVNDYISSNKELLVPYDQIEKDAAESTAYDKYKTDFDSFEALSSQILSLLKAGKYDEAVTNLDEITTSIDQVNSDLEGLISLQTHEADSINTMNMKTYMSSTAISIVIIVIALLAALLIGLYLSITLRKRLKKV